MREQPPEMLGEPISKPEGAPASYEKSLDVVASLRLAGIADPWDDKNPLVYSALKILDEWESACGLPVRGIKNAEKAVNTVNGSMIFIMAGYTGPQFVLQALERLNGEYADLLCEEGNDEIRNILGDAIEALEQHRAQDSPKEKVENTIRERLNTAIELIKTKDIKQVVEADLLLTSTLAHPDYKRYFSKNPEERERVLAFRDRIRVVQKSLRAGGDIAQIDSLLEE